MILTERLKINNVEVAISGYTVNTPPGGLGESVTFALSKPDLTLLPEGAVIKFELGAGKETSPGVIEYSYVTILDTGKMDGRSYSVRWVADDTGGFPGDVFEVSALSPLADKWGLAPQRPVIMYNTRAINAEGLTPEDNQLIRVYDDEGEVSYIRPYLIGIDGLTLYNVLDRAYTNRDAREEIGVNPAFNRVVTNIPNFPLERVDISIEAGFHNSVSGLYAIFNPVVFASDNVLYIIDPDGGLPPEFLPRQLELDCVIEVNETQEPEELFNAVLLSYRERPGGNVYLGERPEIKIIHEEAIESGEGRAYTRTEVFRKVTEFYDINSDELRRVEENEIDTKIYAFRDNIVITGTGEELTRTRVGGEVKLVSHEVIQNFYSGNTKSGHSRTIEGLYYNPEDHGRDAFGEIFTETCQLDWSADMAHPGEYILRWSEVKTEGLVLVETKADGFKVYIPILDATNGGIVESDNTQTLQRLPIETITETLRETGKNQSNVETVIKNHLTGGSGGSVVQNRPGSRSTFLPPFSPRSSGHRAGYIRELIKDDESIALYGLRKPFTLDVGDLGQIEGRRLARRRLASRVNPPLSLSVTLPGIDFLIRRGSLLILPRRNGYTNSMIVTGYKRSGRALGTESARRDMVLELREVKNAGD